MFSLKGVLFGLLFAFTIYAGSWVQLSNQGNSYVYGIKPSCAASASDTITAIDISRAKHFSIGFRGNAVVHSDTAIIDSGFTVNIYLSDTENGTDFYTPSTEDSVTSIYDSRAKASVKGLTLDAKPFVHLVVKRTDTNSGTLDFKTAQNAVQDSILTFTIITDK